MITDIATAHNTVVVVMNGPIIFKYTKVPSIHSFFCAITSNKPSYISMVVAVVDAGVKEVGDQKRLDFEGTVKEVPEAAAEEPQEEAEEVATADTAE